MNDIKLKVLTFIQEVSKQIPEMVETKSLEEIGAFLIEKGIFNSEKDIKCFLFDAAPFMILNEEANLDMPIRYYAEDEEIEEKIIETTDDNIIDFIERSQNINR